MSDEVLRAASVNNEFLRALGETVLAAARLEQLDVSDPGDATSAAEGSGPSRAAAWAGHARELLDERDRFIAAAAAAHDGSTMVRIVARDGSIVPGDATYVAHLGARLVRHRGTGLAMGVPLIADGVAEPRVG